MGFLCVDGKDADKIQYFGPDYELDVRPSNMDNANTKEYLEKIRTQVVENLKRTAFAPSVQMTDVPPHPLVAGIDDEADAILDDLDEDENKDKRVTQRRFDQYVERPGELSDSEEEEEAAANGVRRQPDPLKRRNQINYKHLDIGDSGVESGLATPREASSAADEELDTTGDAKMTEAPDAETEAPRSPSPAEPPSRTEEASAPDNTEMVVDTQGEEEAAAPALFAPVSQQPSPKPDEDTAMEDAQAPAPEPEKLEDTVPSERPQEETKPAEETLAAEKVPETTAPEPLSPPKVPSPPKEVSAPVEEEKANQTEAAEPSKPAETTTELAETKEKTPEAPQPKTSETAAPEPPKGTEEAGETKTSEATDTNNANDETKETPSAPSERKPEEPAKNQE